MKYKLKSETNFIFKCAAPVLLCLYVPLCSLTVKKCSFLGGLQSEMYSVSLLLSLIFAGFDLVLRDWISVPLSASV